MVAIRPTFFSSMHTCRVKFTECCWMKGRWNVNSFLFICVNTFFIYRVEKQTKKNLHCFSVTLQVFCAVLIHWAMDSNAPIFIANHQSRNNVAYQRLSQSASLQGMTPSRQEERFHTSARTVEFFFIYSLFRGSGGRWLFTTSFVRKTKKYLRISPGL